MEARNHQVEQGLMRYTRSSFWKAGLTNFVPAPNQDPDLFESMYNVVAGIDGQINPRPGTTLFSNTGASASGSIIARRIFDAHDSTGRNRFILTCSDASGAASKNNTVGALNEVGGTVLSAPLFTPAATAEHPHAIVHNDFVYFLDGVSTDQKKWNFSDNVADTYTVTNWGISGNLGASDDFDGTNVPNGSITIETHRRYFGVFRNSITGETSEPWHLSDGTTVVIAIGALTDENVEIEGIPVSSDPQVNQRVLLATADGGADDTLYQVAIIEDNTTTTYTDSKTEDELIASPIWAEVDDTGEEIGVWSNTPLREVAPTARFGATHRGRVYVLEGQYLFWSKSVGELITSTGTTTGKWETAFPIENQKYIASDSGETGVGLMSDGVNLYIGTNRNIKLIVGDAPGTSEPRTRYHEVGVLNPYVWRTVYHQGTKVGTIWLTPDLRVIFSDFNTYDDIGAPIQDLLSTMIGARETATATFIANKQYELFLLSDGNGVLLAYNVKSKRWFYWGPADTVYALETQYENVTERVLPVFSTERDGWGLMYRFNTSVVRDRDGVGETPSTPIVTVLTPWLDFGDPAMSKMLNEVEIGTAVPGLSISVFGANTPAQLIVPVPINTGGTTVSASLVPGVSKISLAATNSEYRFYKFSISGLNPTEEGQNFLSYFSVEYAPLANF